MQARRGGCVGGRLARGSRQAGGRSGVQMFQFGQVLLLRRQAGTGPIGGSEQKKEKGKRINPATGWLAGWLADLADRPRAGQTGRQAGRQSINFRDAETCVCVCVCRVGSYLSGLRAGCCSCRCSCSCSCSLARRQAGNATHVRYWHCLCLSLAMLLLRLRL